jgi:hypothetical protein
MVLFIYEFWLNNPDDAPMDPVLARFGPLTESQRRVGKYFLVVVLVLLLQIAAGTIMAHAYYDRRSFYGIALHNVLPFSTSSATSTSSHRSSGSGYRGSARACSSPPRSPVGARRAGRASWSICCSG